MIKKYLTNINNKVYIEEQTILKNKFQTDNIIQIDSSQEITKFYGFGSAITESSAYNYFQLSKENKEQFIKDYFSKFGLNYYYGRISIGSNDFSLKSYLYSKKKDLSDFTINNDKIYIIPFLKDILKTKNISLIASPWSPPRMYKKLPILRFGVKLSKKYYDHYVNYLLKFIDEYNKMNIKVDYLTIQNEPMARQRFESCIFDINDQKEFIYNHLLKKLDKTKLLLWDHNKDNLFNITSELYKKNSHIAGIAFHYYTGNCFSELEKIRKKYKDLLLINTEMCCAYSTYVEKNWISSAEYYLNDIIGDMNSGVNAYLDWNILLDSNGGPTHAKNYVKSASIRDNDSYIKSPIYYYLYHLSHFIDSGSVILKNITNTNLKVVAVKNNNDNVLVIMNKNNYDIKYKIIFDQKEYFDTIVKHSIITYIMSK